MQEPNLNKATLQLYGDHSHAQRICSTSAEQPLRGNTSGGLLLHVKRILKDLNYEKLLFAVVKRNLLTVKMNK